MARSAEQVVRDFCALFETDCSNVRAIVDACTEAVVYSNVPMPPHRGREEVLRFLTPNMTKVDRFQMKILALGVADDGRTVLVERADAFFFGENVVHMAVMGTFVVRDDKIAEWRDYSDFATFVRGMKAIGQSPGPEKITPPTHGEQI